MMMKDNLLKLIKNTRKYKNIQKKVRKDIDKSKEEEWSQSLQHYLPMLQKKKKEKLIAKAKENDKLKTEATVKKKKKKSMKN